MKSRHLRLNSDKKYSFLLITAVLLLSGFNPLLAQKLGTSGSSLHTAIVKYDGTAYTWGTNSFGQLGDNTSLQKNAPVAVYLGTSTSNGALFGKTLTAIAMGLYHTVALDSDGKVYAWGDNNNGQLGNGNNSNSRVPVAVTIDKKITSIAAGSMHAVALAEDGTVYAWGNNYYGQLGDGSTTNRNVPVAVNTSGELNGKKIIAIAGGQEYTVALDNDGKVYAWGTNSLGQLGNDQKYVEKNSLPVAVYIGTSTSKGELYDKKVTAIAAGQSHTVALADNGKVYAWGLCGNGPLGNGISTNEIMTKPVAVNTTGELYGKTITAIAAGSSHTIALDDNGKVYTWGYNAYGQLGNNSTTNSAVPVAVNTTGELNGKTITAIAAGQSHTVALDDKGKVYTWGYNANGQLGNNSTTNSSVPVAVNQIDMGTLPVELSTFTARVSGSGVELLWETATEVNNAVFEIERQSKNDAEWKKIGNVLGNGTSNAMHSYSYFDNSALAGNYKYRLRQVDNDGRFEYSEAIEVCAGVPTVTELVQNYPNPFNPSTVIGYRLSGQENVELSVYNMLGQKVVTLVNERQEAGVYSVRFNASELSSGLYIAKLRTDNYAKTIKMNFVK
ncbi:MAG: T9SS type A sorting domain-containing protein [Bacteroidota bacterium]